MSMIACACTVALQEIVDETDRYIDNLRLQRVNAALLTSNLPRHLRKCAPRFPSLTLRPRHDAPSVLHAAHGLIARPAAPIALRINWSALRAGLLLQRFVWSMVLLGMATVRLL